MLMSMALDGLLDHDERTRLESRIAADPALDEMWQQWCKVDVAFVETPRQLPVVGFTNRFEARLEQKLARERTRQRVIMAAVATVVWTAVLVIAGVLLWFLLMNQGELMGAVARETAYYGRAIGIGIGALQTTASATFSAPQSMVIALAYAVATAGLLYVWVRFLRRTTYESGMYQSGIESGNEEM
jgi:anti-sigma factor RsiW